jgi:hypothetical protein
MMPQNVPARIFWGISEYATAPGTRPFTDSTLPITRFRSEWYFVTIHFNAPREAGERLAGRVPLYWMLC